MAYSDTLKVFWFNPMRTASRSTKEIQIHLGFKDPGAHYPPTEKYKEYYIVSGFRNPYSRFVSIFHFIFDRETRTTDEFKAFAKKKIWEEKNLINRPNYQLNLSDIFEYQKFKPQYLVRVENLYEDIMNLWFVKEKKDDKLLEIMDSYVNTNNFHHEQGPRPSWQEHYDEETANLVYDFFIKDFELGGYDKNSWKDGTS